MTVLFNSCQHNKSSITFNLYVVLYCTPAKKSQYTGKFQHALLFKAVQEMVTQLALMKLKDR